MPWAVNMSVVAHVVAAMLTGMRAVSSHVPLTLLAAKETTDTAKAAVANRSHMPSLRARSEQV